MKKLICILIVLLFISINLFAGWARTYGGSNYDKGYSVHQTTDGGFIVTGYTDSYGVFGDVYLIKTNTIGDVLWFKTFGGDSFDEGQSVQQTTDGGYIIAGVFNLSMSDIWLIKTDTTGDTLWTKTYGGYHHDWSYSVQQTNDGGYIITGFSQSFGAGGCDVYLIKTDNMGDTLWTRIFGSDSFNDIGYSVKQTSDGGFIVAGYTWSYAPGLDDVYLIKTDSNGDTIWTKILGGDYDDNVFSIEQTSDGGYITTGYTESYGAGSADVYLIKTYSNGDTIWTKTYGGNDWDEGRSVQQTTDGGYIIAGYTNSYGAGNFDVWLIKTDSNGDTIWTKTFGGASNDRCYSVQQTTDGGYIIAGFTYSYGAGSYDVWLIKTDENGVVVEETIISTPNNFYYNIKQTSDNNISLEFSLPQNSNVELNIYDVSGRYILTPISGNYSAGTHNVTFKTENSGVYFFNLKTNRISENGKFIVF